jgi:hypothetical protein
MTASLLAAVCPAAALEPDFSGFEAHELQRDSGLDGAMRARRELERLRRNNIDMGGAMHSGASMQREADRAVREARFQSTMDVGVLIIIRNLLRHLGLCFRSRLARSANLAGRIRFIVCAADYSS